MAGQDWILIHFTKGFNSDTRLPSKRFPAETLLEDLCREIAEKFKATDEALPVAHLTLGDVPLNGAGDQKYNATLRSLNVTDGSTINVILSKPPRTCQVCDPSAEFVGIAGSVASGWCGRFRLQCCGVLLCQKCADDSRRDGCPRCFSRNPEADEIGGNRSNWSGLAKPEASHIPEIGNPSETEDAQETIVGMFDGGLRVADGPWLLLFDLNGTLLHRPRQGASVEGAQCLVKEFPDGGYREHAYRIYLRQGLAAELLTSLTALNLEWGFWTNQMTRNALPSIRALLDQAVHADVQRIPSSSGQEYEEARLRIREGEVDRMVWAFDQGYCMDDPKGGLYPNDQPVQVYNLTAVAEKCGRTRILVVSAGEKNAADSMRTCGFLAPHLTRPLCAIRLKLVSQMCCSRFSTGAARSLEVLTIFASRRYITTA